MENGIDVTGHIERQAGAENEHGYAEVVVAVKHNGRITVREGLADTFNLEPDYRSYWAYDTCTTVPGEGYTMTIHFVGSIRERD